MEAVNQQPWDVSVKGLTQFSDVLTQIADEPLLDVSTR